MTASGLPNTIVFVDYESWFWGLYNQYGERPDVEDFMQKVKQRGVLDDLYFFGDFNKDEIGKERDKLRNFSSNIIDCANENRTKDYTDFIMLDNIYRTVVKRSDVEQYVLVTGDGHFHSVAAWLKNFRDKIVGVYGVQGSLSNQLKNCASWWEEIRPEGHDARTGDLAGGIPEGGAPQYAHRILESIREKERSASGLRPTFSNTVAYCRDHFGMNEKELRATLAKLINDGFVNQEVQTLRNGDKITVVVPQWNLLAEHELWKETV